MDTGEGKGKLQFLGLKTFFSYKQNADMYSTRTLVAVATFLHAHPAPPSGAGVRRLPSGGESLRIRRPPPAPRPSGRP